MIRSDDGRSDARKKYQTEMKANAAVREKRRRSSAAIIEWHLLELRARNSVPPKTSSSGKRKWMGGRQNHWCLLQSRHKMLSHEWCEKGGGRANMI
jgi:hypothetical protein